MRFIKRVAWFRCEPLACDARHRQTIIDKNTCRWMRSNDFFHCLADGQRSNLLNFLSVLSIFPKKYFLEIKKSPKIDYFYFGFHCEFFDNENGNLCNNFAFCMRVHSQGHLILILWICCKIECNAFSKWKNSTLLDLYNTITNWVLRFKGGEGRQRKAALHQACTILSIPTQF